MPVQNPGVTSLFALHNLHKTERQMGTSIERLSSGKRINHAGDDAAGGAIADRMTSQIKGLNMSVRNASDVLSMAQVAEGALDESSKVLQRIRELAIQSASDLMNGEERLYLQTEANQLISELDRVARDTTFNEIAVLDGTFADRRFQIGAKEREAATISVGNLRTESIGNHIVRTSAATGATVSATAVSLGSADTFADEDFTIHGLLGSKTIDVVAGTSAKDIAEAVNIQFDQTGVSATASTNMKIQAKGTAGSATLSIGLKGKNSTVRTVSAGITLAAAVTGSDLTGLSNAINAYSAETGIVATLKADKTTIYLTNDEGHDIALTDLDFADTTDDSRDLQVTGMDARLFDASGDEILSGTAKTMTDTSHSSGSGKDAIVGGQIMMHGSHSFTVTTTNTNGDIFQSSPGAATLNKVSELSLRTRSKAIDALKVVDKALDKVHMERAKLGAVMSRMHQAIDNLTNVSANTASARSRIVDADMAAESAELAKSQVLQQSAMAMIAQASRAQQSILTLLQGM